MLSISELLVQGAVTAALGAYSVVKECAEELFVDPILDDIVTRVVADLGGDETAQMIASILVESGREGFTGMIGDVLLTIPSIDHFVTNIKIKLLSKLGLLQIQQDANEIRMAYSEEEYWKLRSQYSYALGSATDSQISRILFALSYLSSEVTGSISEFSVDEGLTLLNEFAKQGFVPEISSIGLIKAMELAEGSEGTLVEVSPGTPGVSPSVSQEISNEELYCIPLFYQDESKVAELDKHILPKVKKKDIPKFVEQDKQGYTGVDSPAESFGVWAIPGPTDINRPQFFIGKVPDIDAYGGEMGIPFIPEEPGRYNIRTAISEYIKEKSVMTTPRIFRQKGFTRQFREWFEEKYGVPLPGVTFQRYREGTHFSKQVEAYLLTDMYLWLYKDHIENKLYLSYYSSMEAIIGRVTYNIAEEFMNSRPHYGSEILNKFPRRKLLPYSAIEIISTTLMHYEFLFGLEEQGSENILSYETAREIRKILKEYRNTAHIYTTDSAKGNQLPFYLLEEWDIIHDIQFSYFKQCGIILSYRKLSEKIGTDLSKHLYQEKKGYLTDFNMWKVQNWVKDTIHNEEDKSRILNKISNWVKETEGDSVYFIQDTPIRRVTYAILELWRKTFGEEISTTELSHELFQFLDSIGIKISKDYLQNINALAQKFTIPLEETWEYLISFIEFTFMFDRLIFNNWAETFEIREQAQRIIDTIEVYRDNREDYIVYTGRKLNRLLGIYAHPIIEYMVYEYFSSTDIITWHEERISYRIDRDLARRFRADTVFVVDDAFKTHFRTSSSPIIYPILYGQYGGDNIEYFVVDYISSTQKDLILEKIPKYLGENRHVVIVIYGQDTETMNFQRKLFDLRKAAAIKAQKFMKDNGHKDYKNYGDYVHIVTLEEFAEDFEIQSMLQKGPDGKNWIESLFIKMEKASKYSKHLEEFKKLYEQYFDFIKQIQRGVTPLTRQLNLEEWFDWKKLNKLLG